jgi:urease accessory protein
VLKDNILLQPQQAPPDTIGQWEGYTHQGTLIYLNTGQQPATAYIPGIQRTLEEEKDVRFGISATAANGFVLRILGNGGEQLYNCFRRVQERLWNGHSTYQATIPIQQKTVPV